MKIELETPGPGDEAWSIIETKHNETNPVTGFTETTLENKLVTGKIEAVVVYVANPTDDPVVEYLYERSNPNLRHVRAYNAYATEAEAKAALEEVNKEKEDDKGKD